MTKDELRPLLKRAFDAGAADALRRLAGENPYAVEPATFSAAPTHFTADDAARYADYFAADDGYYPTRLHAYFGCDPRTFADRTGLVRKQITDKNGHRVWHWVKRQVTGAPAPAKEPAKGPEPVKGAKQPKEPKRPKEPAARPSAEPLHPSPDRAREEHARRAADEIAVELVNAPDLPDAPQLKAPAMRARVADLALAAAARAYKFALDVTHSKAAGQVGELLEAVFDVPTDLAKLGYNPNTSSGTANPTVFGPVKAQLGISGHLVASLASKVLVKALYAAKNKLKGRPAQMSDGADGTAADWLADLFDAVHESLGLPPVDREAVRAAVARAARPTS